ncbi:MAG: hypothetical protein AAFW68_13600 [Pseudomonadota bacterium]
MSGFGVSKIPRKELARYVGHQSDARGDDKKSNNDAQPNSKAEGERQAQRIASRQSTSDQLTTTSIEQRKAKRRRKEERKIRAELKTQRCMSSTAHKE